MTKYLGIDYGERRTGLAITDPEGKLVFPLLTLTLTQNETRSGFLNELAEIAAQKSVDAIVIGLPLHGDGSESDMAVQVRHIARRLKDRLPLPLYFMPELLSTDHAKSELKQAGLRGKKLKRVLDQQAACKILESFLQLSEDQRKTT